MATIPESGLILSLGGLWPFMMTAAFVGFALPGAKEADRSTKEKQAGIGKQPANDAIRIYKRSL